jgi:hypothetical protein
VDVKATSRGTTIRLSEGETEELLTAFALTMAAYGLLQNFMTPAQKGMTLPSVHFISQLGVAVWDALPVKPGEQSQTAASPTELD